VSHRDIKPENFMFEDIGSDNLKLIDFGLSSIIVPRNDLVHQRSRELMNMKTVVGTVWYMAPEVY
jgi:serine/threonine protein kinase